MKNVKIEKELIKKALEILTKRKALFLKKGIISDLPKIDGKATSIDGHDSEFRLFFSTENEFLDGIELFLYKDGKPICSIEEMINYIEKEIDRIILEA